MTLVYASRVNYFDRQFIRLAELRDEQAYHLEQRRRHNLSHHTWGIVVGLEIVEEEGRPVLQPGLAVDGYGRDLLLLDRAAFGREQFDRLAASRLDLWLEYRLDGQDARLAPAECGDNDPSRRYRAIERAEVVVTRGGARPDPRRPPGVPAAAFDAPMLATPDDAGLRWPVYLGRIIMEISADGATAFTIEAGDRAYAGLNSELIDHPGNASRIELGRRPPRDDYKTVGNTTYRYAKDAERDFAVFAPGPQDALTLQPTLAVYGTATQIRGSTEVHGNIVLDGAALQFPDDQGGLPDAADLMPSLYRAGSELRIDLGSIEKGQRALVIGTLQGDEFKPALEVRFAPAAAGGKPRAVVTVHGDLHVEGRFESPDVRTRTVTAEVAALLTGVLQAGSANSGA